MPPMCPRSPAARRHSGARGFPGLLLAGLIALPLAGLPALTPAQASAGTATDELEPLPRPLRLQHALEAVDAQHPRLREARAQRKLAEQELAGTRAGRDLSIDARLQARWVEPNDRAPDQRNNDSQAAVVARKLLSDFGHSSTREAAGEQQVEAARQRETLAHARHRIQVMERYFDVLLADLAFARDTEAMAAAYVSKERAEERHQLGQVSEIEVFRLEAEYQTLRVQRQRALQTQRRARAELAEALNRPQETLRDVLAPALPLDLPELPPLEELLEEVDTGSPLLTAERRQVEAASRQVEAARAQRRPRLYAEAEAGYWNRQYGGDRNDFAGGLVLEVPLYEGRRHDSRVGQALATRQHAEAGLGQARIEARNRLRELYHEAEALQVQRDEAAWRMDYRELYIDRARYLYDIEDQADLGDSMVQQSAAAFFNARTELELAMTYERLALLTGRPDLSPFATAAATTE